MRSLLLASLAVGASAWAPLSARAAARGAALRMSAPVTDEASAVAAAITGRMKERGIMPAPVLPMLEGFFATYVDCLQRSDVADEVCRGQGERKPIVFSRPCVFISFLAGVVAIVSVFNLGMGGRDW